MLCKGNLPANYHHMCQVMGRSLRGLMSNSPHRVFPPISAYCSPRFMHLSSPVWGCFSTGGESAQVLRHLCFTPALSSTESKHGGQLPNLAMLAINHPLDCQTHRDKGRIGNTLHCILFFSSSFYSFFNHLFLSMTKFKEQTLNHTSSFLKIPLFYCWQVWFLHSPLLLFYLLKIQIPFLVSLLIPPSLTYLMILADWLRQTYWFLFPSIFFPPLLHQSATEHSAPPFVVLSAWSKLFLRVGVFVVTFLSSQLYSKNKTDQGHQGRKLLMGRKGKESGNSGSEKHYR